MTYLATLSSSVPHWQPSVQLTILVPDYLNWMYAMISLIGMITLASFIFVLWCVRGMFGAECNDCWIVGSWELNFCAYDEILFYTNNVLLLQIFTTATGRERRVGRALSLLCDDTIVDRVRVESFSCIAKYNIYHGDGHYAALSLTFVRQNMPTMTGQLSSRSRS